MLKFLDIRLSPKVLITVFCVLARIDNYKNVIDYCSYAHNLSSCKIKA